MTAHPPRFDARDIMVAVVMNIMWGFNIIAVKMGVELVGAMPAAFLRQATVLVLCLPYLKIVPGRMRALLALGFLSGGAFYIVLNSALAISDNIGALAIAGQLSVPFSLILAIIVLGERIHIIRTAGIALSFAGVVLLVFDPAAAREIPGILLTAFSGVIWAICSLLQRKLVGVQVLTIYAWIGLAGSVVLLPVALIFEPAHMRSIPHIPLTSFGWIAFSAIGSTIIGQGAMSWLLQRHDVTTVVPLTLATPVLSVIFASIYFATPVTPLMIVGGLISLTGVAIVTFRTASAAGELR